MALAKRRFKESLNRGETFPYVCTFRDKPIDSLKTAWLQALEHAETGRRLRLYDIRHFYITHALAAGASIQELAERVGHTDGTMIVKVSSHMVEELRSKQAFAIPKLLVKPPMHPAGHRKVSQKVSHKKEGLGEIA